MGYSIKENNIYSIPFLGEALLLSFLDEMDYLDQFGFRPDHGKETALGTLALAYARK